MSIAEKTILAVVPARGGSKGIPGKNLALAGGRPLLAWTLDAARTSQFVDRTVVSTDDPSIAATARDLGGEAPFLRPAEISGDSASPMLAIDHALAWLEREEGWRPDYVMLLQPTSPLRLAEDIDNACRLAVEKDADAVVSVTEAVPHPYLTRSIDSDGKLADFLTLPGGYPRRQDFPDVYTLNGAIYLAKREILASQGTFYTSRTYAYVMPTARSLDIDTPWELHLADLLLREKPGNQCHHGGTENAE